MAKHTQHIAQNDSGSQEESPFIVNPDLKPLTSSHPVIEQKREDFKPFAGSMPEESYLKLDSTLYSDSQRKKFSAAAAEQALTSKRMSAFRESQEEAMPRRERLIESWIKVAVLVHGVYSVVLDSFFSLLSDNRKR